jgi:tetratricopeptide (TPR) repeat protein
MVRGARGEFESGLEALDRAIAAHPDLVDLYEAKADLLFEAGRGAQGVAVIERALERKPRSISLLYALGALHERMGQIDKSIQAMRRLLEIDPNNSSALNFIGYTLADQGRELEEAERLIRRALLLNPGNGAITDSLGWVLYQKGDYAQALEYLQRADRVTPGEPVIIMHVGDAYRKLGQVKEALAAYRRALAAGPEERVRRQLQQRLKEMQAEPTGGA